MAKQKKGKKKAVSKKVATAVKKKAFSFPKLNLANKKQGYFAALVGIILALIIGIFAVIYVWQMTWLWWVLGIGVIVGILNIFHKDTSTFLITGLVITFMLTILGSLLILPVWLLVLFNAVIYLLAPASVIVGLKVIYALAIK